MVLNALFHGIISYGNIIWGDAYKIILPHYGEYKTEYEN